MYYENKSAFYIKQYGPIALIITVAVLLISMGIFFGIQSFGNKDKAVVVSEQETTTSNLPAELNNLSKNEKSKEYKVTAVTEESNVVIEVSNKKYEITLIGVKPKDNNVALQTKVIDELKNNKVKIAFDDVREENGNIYAYVYLNDKLYNEQILSDGFGELKAERKNIDKLDILLAAEIKARHEFKGVWNI